jgi:hypothetical protein
MNQGTGAISRIYGWLWHPSNSTETLTEWAAGLVVILIVSFLWSTVIKVVD